MKTRLIPFFLALLLSGCEKAIEGYESSDSSGNVTLRMSPFTQEAMTRAATPLADACSRLNVMAFRFPSGSKAFSKIKTQTRDNALFGQMSLSLAEGDYDILCVGHSSARSATLAMDKVSFTAHNGQKITDTFWWYGRIEVRGEDDRVYDIELDRATALFRMVIIDDTPANVVQFKFEYQGGSADFHPATGVGITNSKQNELRDRNSSSQYEIFTFPKNDNPLTINAYALDAGGTIISQRTFVDVPVKARYITTYRGRFFDGASGIINGNSLSISVNDEWEGSYEGEF